MEICEGKIFFYVKCRCGRIFSQMSRNQSREGQNLQKFDQTISNNMNVKRNVLYTEGINEKRIKYNVS